MRPPALIDLPTPLQVIGSVSNWLRVLSHLTHSSEMILHNLVNEAIATTSFLKKNSFSGLV